MPTTHALTMYHLPFIILVSIIGYEISGYFLYLYISHKREHLKLDKILLAYGLLYGFALTGAAIRTIATYYLSSGNSQNILILISHILIATAATSFQTIVSSKIFNEILSVKVSKVILLETIVISTLLIVVNSPGLQFFLIIIAVFTGTPYILAFHYCLIKRVHKPIKKRIKMIVFGDALMVIGIFAEAKEILPIFPTSFHSFLIFGAAPIIFFGLLFVFFGIFQFPVFLEFEWKENLVAFFVIDSKSSQLLYSFDFLKRSTEKSSEDKGSYIDSEKNLFFSKSISGIENVTSLITNSEVGKITKIKQGNLIIQLKYGEGSINTVLFALLIKKEMNSSTYFLKDLAKKFKSFYGSLLNTVDFNLGSEQKIFSSFDDVIVEIINYPKSDTVW